MDSSYPPRPIRPQPQHTTSSGSSLSRSLIFDRPSTPSSISSVTTFQTSSSDLSLQTINNVTTTGDTDKASSVQPQKPCGFPLGFVEGVITAVQDSVALLAGPISNQDKDLVQRYLNSWANLDAKYCFGFRKENTGSKEDSLCHHNPKDALESIWLPFVSIGLELPRIQGKSIEKLAGGLEGEAYYVETTFNLWAVSALNPDLIPLAGRGYLSDTILVGPTPKILKRTMVISRETLPEYTRVVARGSDVNQLDYSYKVPAFIERFFFFSKIVRWLRSLTSYIQILVILAAVAASIQNIGIQGKAGLSLAIIGVVSAVMSMLIWAADRIVELMDSKTRRDELRLMTGKTKKTLKGIIVNMFAGGYEGLTGIFRRHPISLPESVTTTPEVQSQTVVPEP